MKSKDILKFIFAKLLLKETILFSKKDDWESYIRKQIKKYIPFFYEFDEVNPNSFDVVVPLTIEAQKYISAHPELLTQHKAVIPSDICIDLCNDKKNFHNFLEDNNFLMFAPRISKKLSYPYVLKKRVGAWGEGISIIIDSQTEVKHINEIGSDEYFKQEYIEGQEEYTTHVIMLEKKIVFLKTLKFAFSERFYIKGKNFNYTSEEEVDHNHFKNTFEEILVKMNYQGICCFNYKIINKSLMIFEINPRYGASMTRFINEALISYIGTNNNV